MKRSKVNLTQRPKLTPDNLRWLGLNPQYQGLMLLTELEKAEAQRLAEAWRQRQIDNN